jgi:hypothetical protein
MENKEAIKEDIQDVSIDELEPIEIEEEEKEAPRLSARDQKMKDVVDKRQQELANNDGEPVVEREFQQVGAEPKPEEDNLIAAAPQSPSPVYLNDEGEYVTKIKVNGVEIERPFSQVVATAQKQESGDIKLQRANEREHKLNEYEQLLRSEEARILAQRTSPPSNEQDAGIERSEQLQVVMEHLLDGQTKEAADILDKLMSGRQEPTFDVNDITRRAKEETIQALREENRKHDYSISLSNGIKWLEEQHPDVISDTNLYSIIDGQTDVISRREPNLTPEEVIKKATETVLSLRGIETPANSRDANKSQLKSQPKSRAGLRHSPPQKPVLDTSPAAVIARQKAQRSQVANRRSV